MNNVIYLRESVLNKTFAKKFMTLHFSEKATSNHTYIAVAMYSRDQNEIIRLREISQFIKQPCVMLSTLIYVFSVVILIIRINHVIKRESIA